MLTRLIFQKKWFRSFCSQWMMINNNKKYVIVILGIVLLSAFFVVTIYFSGHGGSSTHDAISLQTKRSETILRELNTIRETLRNVESNPNNTKQQQVAFQTIEKNIALIQESIVNVAKNADVLKIATQISSVKSDIDSQLSDLKKTVSESKGNKNYLEPAALPFHVISIDVIAGQVYVSVNYANHIAPLGIGDMLAEWRLNSANYDEGVAEFVNEKNQFVRISLQGV